MINRYYKKFLYFSKRNVKNNAQLNNGYNPIVADYKSHENLSSIKRKNIRCFIHR